MTVTSKGNRCGTSWLDANENCSNFCASDGECITPDNTTAVSRCFAGLSNACPVSLKRCGTSYAHANANCGTYCLSNDWCPAGEYCYGDLADICDFRCGKTWNQANKKCKNQCRSGDSTECPAGESCFGQLVKYCANSRASTTHSSMFVWLLLVVVLFRQLRA